MCSGAQVPPWHDAKPTLSMSWANQISSRCLHWKCATWSNRLTITLYSTCANRWYTQFGDKNGVFSDLLVESLHGTSGNYYGVFCATAFIPPGSEGVEHKANFILPSMWKGYETKGNLAVSVAMASAVTIMNWCQSFKVPYNLHSKQLMSTDLTQWLWSLPKECCIQVPVWQ